MINKDKIKYNEAIYYTPTYGGAIKVSIIKTLNDILALVKPTSKKKDFKPFAIPIEHIYNKPEHAQRGCREWEHYMRHLHIITRSSNSVVLQTSQVWRS